MLVVTWNVNSLKARAQHVADLLDRVSPSVLCMQELKQEDHAVAREIFEDRGYHLQTHGQRTYNGVAIASKLPMRDVRTGFPGDQGESRFIHAVVDGVRILNLYCPQGRAVDDEKFQYKLSFYDHLIQWVADNVDPDEPFVMTGDLNIAPEPDDVYSVERMTNQVSYHPLEHARFQALLDWGLVDASKPYLPARSFTFWDYRMNCWKRDVGFRIDHFLVTAPVLARVQGSRVLRDERGKERASDHAPVTLHLG